MNTEFSPSNITSGAPAARLGATIIGQIGYFYSKGPVPLEPQNGRRLVKVTGFHQDRGVVAYTFADVESVTAGFTRVEGVRFAKYIDQAEAAEVFESRRVAYRAVYQAYNHASATEDTEAKAYSRAVLEGLKTV